MNNFSTAKFHVLTKIAKALINPNLKASITLYCELYFLITL